MNSRQQEILNMLQWGGISIKDAALKLSVTEMTLRRDLKYLSERNLAILVKGGAIPYPAQYVIQHGPIAHQLEKMAICEALYKRILPARSLFIGTGTTTLTFAGILARRNRNPITVITNSLPVASALFRSSCKVILLGGELRLTSLDLVGPIAEKSLEEYHVDWLVTGCDGADCQEGFYTADVNLANMEHKSIAIADKVAVVSDSSKFGQRAITRFALPSDVDLLVTDDGWPSDAAASFTNTDMEIIRCGSSLLP